MGLCKCGRGVETWPLLADPCSGQRQCRLCAAEEAGGKDPHSPGCNCPRCFAAAWATLAAANARLIAALAEIQTIASDEGKSQALRLTLIGEQAARALGGGT
jgi:hypothetical protein